MTILLTAEQIAERTRELAAQIRAEHPHEDLHLVGVLKGSFLFLADLCRQLEGNVTVDFIQTSSYGTQRSTTGIVQIRKDLDVNIEGKHVFIVEDIIDSGLTLSHLLEVLGTRRPASLKVVTLLSKPACHRIALPIDYVGFEIPEKFVVGYGLDDGERYRNLPYIAQIDEAE